MKRATIIGRVLPRADCPFADDVDGQRACAAKFVELHPSGITCFHCPSRQTPPADAAAHLRVIRDQPYVGNEQRAAIDRVLGQE